MILFIFTWFNFTGVYSVIVGLLSQKAEILFDPDETCEETLKNHIEALGFGAEQLQDTTSNERTIEFDVSYIFDCQTLSLSPLLNSNLFRSIRSRIFHLILKEMFENASDVIFSLMLTNPL